jgi:hypothetical protein
MMKMKAFSLCLLLAAWIRVEASDPALISFPLWGSSWVICQGDNDRVFPSVAPLRPKTIMHVTFQSSYTPENATIYSVRIRWANCNHTDYACTADLLDNILYQFRRNDLTVSDTAINKDSVINIVYNTYNDTVWTLDKALADLPPKYDEFYRKIDGEVAVLSGSQGKYDLRNSPVYTQEKPVAWARRLRSDPEDRRKYSIDIEVELEEGITEIQSIANAAASSSLPVSEFTDYCNSRYCFEAVHDYRFRTDNLGYWQVHIFPEIKYFPRDASSGTPNLKVPPMGMKEAFEKKRQSINDPDNIDFKDYRSPFLSDSASSIISFSFTDDGSSQNPMNRRRAIWLSGSAIESKMQYEHFPAKMYRVESETEESLIKAILMCYTEDDENEEEMATLDNRCSTGWRVIDKKNSKVIFPEKDRADGRFRQDNTVNTGIFTYNNCPCTYIVPYGMTAAQLRKFVFKAVPSCSYESMRKALSFYKSLQLILKAPEDQDLLRGRIETVVHLMRVREDIYSTDNTRNWSDSEKNCPGTWVDNLPWE